MAGQRGCSTTFSFTDGFDNILKASGLYGTVDTRNPCDDCRLDKKTWTFHYEYLDADMV